MTTAFHAKYFAHELTRKHRPGATDRLSMALFDACVDLNPHQIEAAMFAMRSPLTKGVILCDCLLYTSPSPRDLSTSRMPSSA